jgi:hypothetical protein
VEKVKVQVPKDLAQRADEYVRFGGDGFGSINEVASDALRWFLDEREASLRERLEVQRLLRESDTRSRDAADPLARPWPRRGPDQKPRAGKATVQE